MAIFKHWWAGTKIEDIDDFELMSEFENVAECRVWPGDVDTLMHMNNARYNRRAEWSGSALQAKCGLWLRNPGLKIFKKMGMSGSYLRFRKEIQPFQAFKVISKYAGCTLKHQKPVVIGDKPRLG